MTKFFKPVNKILPNKENIRRIINEYLDKYNNDKYYKYYIKQKECLNKLFEEIYPCNTDETEVLAKVACLNAYYNTNVLALSKMAHNIVSIKNIDKRLKYGDENLVSEIAMVPEINNRVFYSFATKYCFRYNKSAFPIFDSNVEYVLKLFIKEQSLPTKYKVADLRNYTTFKEIINKFRDYYNLREKDYSIKDLDHFMWMYGGKMRNNNA